MTCLVYFRIEKIRDNGNKTGLKEGGGIEIENLQVLSIYAMLSLPFAFFDFTYLYR